MAVALAPVLAIAALLAAPAALPAFPLEIPGNEGATKPLGAEQALGQGLALRGPVPAALPAPTPASLTDAVRSAYARLGLPVPDAEATARMAEQEVGLPGAFARDLAVLVAALAAHDAAQVGPSALRIARAADAVAAGLAQAQGAEGDVLFRDPFDLVLVGGPGPTTYRGNALPPGVPIAPRANLLTVDVGGDDLYLNDAGGASTGAQVCAVQGCGNGLPAAVALDAAGNDHYLRVEATDGDAVVAAQGGGAYFAVGLLLDLAGDDAYEARLSTGADAAWGGLHIVQGAALFDGVGLLLDAGGRDTYLATADDPGRSSSPQMFAQGAGQQQGLGVLLDAEGGDAYTAVQWSAQGFAALLAQGTGAIYGQGLLADLGGDDRYTALLSVTQGTADLHVQGSGEANGLGVLADRAGDDAYFADQPGMPPEQAPRIAQGEANLGYALLLDGGGSDTYSEAHAGDHLLWFQGQTGFGADL